MQIIHDLAEASLIGDPELRQHIGRVFASVSDCPEILGFILIVEAGDSIATLDTQLGFPILSTPREIVEEHAGYFEMVFVISDDGSGMEVFVPKEIDMPELLAVCIKHALPAESTP